MSSIHEKIYTTLVKTGHPVWPLEVPKGRGSVIDIVYSLISDERIQLINKHTGNLSCIFQVDVYSTYQARAIAVMDNITSQMIASAAFKTGEITSNPDQFDTDSNTYRCSRDFTLHYKED